MSMRLPVHMSIHGAHVDRRVYTHAGLQVFMLANYEEEAAHTWDDWGWDMEYVIFY